jgi:hypothetical protein
MSFAVDTAEEAANLVERLKRQEIEEAKKRAWDQAYDRDAVQRGGPGALAAFMRQEIETPWAPEIFIRFIDRLGPPQQKALAFLVSGGRVTDEDLRETVGAANNQALAGILSGISKQAAGLEIPARDIFRIENLRIGGKRQSIYIVADKFQAIASEMNWPSSV